MISFKRPSLSIVNLVKIIKNWKIVIIGANPDIDKNWKRFKFSNKLFYISIKEQIRLNYKISKYIKYNSYFRKSIGYLYAIQHGAKEIYELDENLEIKDINHLYENLNNKKVSYGKRNDDMMINPFFYFGEKNIWPRGFRINNLGRDDRNEFYLINSGNIGLKPLVYQGLINIYPDIDYIFFLTKIRGKKYYFSKNYPLVYLPGNYIPINSKNTRYLYEAFLLLMFFISLDERIADIWRGYIIQFFIWKYEGCVVYHNSEIFQYKISDDATNLFKEKKNYFDIDRFLNILNSNEEDKNLLDLIKLLIKHKILKQIDFKIYKTFIIY